MAKPTTLPEWATGATGIAETTEPSAGKKADGWADAELPPHNFFNWLFNVIYTWFVWLSAQLREEEQLIVDVMGGFASVATPVLQWDAVLGVVDVVAAGAGNEWQFGLPLNAGNYVTAVDFFYKRAGGTLTFSLLSMVNGAPAVVASGTISTGTAATTFTLPVNAALAPSKLYRLAFLSGAAGDILIGAVVRYNRSEPT